MGVLKNDEQCCKDEFIHGGVNEHMENDEQCCKEEYIHTWRSE